VPACPFEVIVLHDVPDQKTAVPQHLRAPQDENGGAATKCDRCLSRTNEPACVTSCPYDAVRRGKPFQLFPGLRDWAEVVPAAEAATP
jgi:Fe-S-cluster-containing hydrogenase component 2